MQEEDLIPTGKALWLKTTTGKNFVVSYPKMCQMNILET